MQALLHGCSSVLQRWAKVGAPGLVNFITAVAYHFCSSLPAAFTQPGASTLADLCINYMFYEKHFSFSSLLVTSHSLNGLFEAEISKQSTLTSSLIAPLFLALHPAGNDDHSGGVRDSPARRSRRPLQASPAALPLRLRRQGQLRRH